MNQGLKGWWPRAIVTLGLIALAAGLTGIFTWVARQQSLDACMPEFIGLLLLAGILYAIGGVLGPEVSPRNNRSPDYPGGREFCFASRCYRPRRRLLTMCIATSGMVGCNARI